MTSLPFMGRERPRSGQGGGVWGRAPVKETIVVASDSPTLPMLRIGCPSPRGERRVLERQLNRLDHAVEIRTDIGIPESQRVETSLAEDRITHGIVSDLPLVISVLAAVDLDDQAAPEADEVEVEAVQRGLTTKVETVGAHLPKL